MAAKDPFASVPKLERASTAEETASRLREMILSGELEPGTPLTETPLARAFEVSRTAIREALMLLARDGIVTQHRHRGAVVTTLDEEDIRDLYDARRLIEMAAIDASSADDEKGLGALEAAAENLEAALNADDWGEIPKADILFHHSLVGLLRNARLESFFSQLETELRFAALVTSRWDVQHGQSVVDDHREVLKSLKAGRRDEAKARLSKHLDESEEHFRSSPKEIVRQPNN